MSVDSVETTMTETTPDGPTDFDQFLASGTVGHKTVKIYNDAALVSQIEELLERREALEKNPPERSAAETDPLEAIDAEMEELNARFEASVALFRIEPVLPDEEKAIKKAHPDPDAPPPLMPNAPKSAQDANRKKRHAFMEAAAEASLARNIAFTAKAIKSVTLANGTVIGPPTVEQLRALRARPHGEVQLDSLFRAAREITDGTVEPARPTSPASSRSDRG